MRYKNNVLEILDKISQILETSTLLMENRTVTPVQLYKNLKNVILELERVSVLIKRESDEN